MANLVTTIRPVRDLTADQRQAMFRLYSTYYVVSDETVFAADLAGKDHVLRVLSPGGTLCGFTTMAVREHELHGRRLRSIFSGDTIMHPDFWGRQDLAFNWIRFAGTVKAREPAIPLYWFLIVKGHRTYRYLSAFSLTFFPHWAQETPAFEQDVMHHLAHDRFGTHYDPSRGVIRFPSSRGHLREDLATVPEADDGVPT